MKKVIENVVNFRHFKEMFLGFFKKEVEDFVEKNSFYPTTIKQLNFKKILKKYDEVFKTQEVLLIKKYDDTFNKMYYRMILKDINDTKKSMFSYNLKYQKINLEVLEKRINEEIEIIKTTFKNFIETETKQINMINYLVKKDGYYYDYSNEKGLVKEYRLSKDSRHSKLFIDKNEAEKIAAIINGNVLMIFITDKIIRKRWKGYSECLYLKDKRVVKKVFDKSILKNLTYPFKITKDKIKRNILISY